METVTGIFASRPQAEQAISQLIAEAHFNRDNLMLLTPSDSADVAEKIPSDEGEQPGMGSAIGGVVGGAVGLATGAVLSNLIFPGIGPILTLTLSAGGGLGGVFAGAAGGSAAERALSNGLPKDELFFYEDALRRCRVVAVAISESRERAGQARAILERNGAESVDAAREKWWIGIRDAEASEFGSAPRDCTDEGIYRAGFEAALGPEFRNKNFNDAETDLKRRYPDMCSNEIFRRGYERGRQYFGGWCRSGASAGAALRRREERTS